MPLSQLRNTMEAKKHGAFYASATAMHGSARFKHERDAQSFLPYIQHEYVVHVFSQGSVTAVDWTSERMANGHITPIRSESKEGKP